MSESIFLRIARSLEPDCQEVEHDEDEMLTDWMVFWLLPSGNQMHLHLFSGTLEYYTTEPETWTQYTIDAVTLTKGKVWRRNET